MRKLIGFGLAASALWSLPAGAATVVNGGFEAPDVGTGYASYPTGSSFSGWDVIGAGDVAPISGSFSGTTFPAQEGKQWLDLTGTNTGVQSGVQQAIATSAGSLYTLSFYIGNIVAPGFGATSSVDVRINGTSVGIFSNILGAGSPSQVWQNFTVPFAATGSSTLIGFINLDPSGDHHNGLDNVQVLDAGAGAVPEPATWAMILLGFGAVGFAMRRRKSASRAPRVPVGCA